MSARDRVRRYRENGGAADLVRLEVLVAPGDRAAVLQFAKQLRERHRAEKREIEDLIVRALSQYSVRILDNIDLDRLPNLPSKAKVIAGALMDRGDARAFALGRKILDRLPLEAVNGPH